MGIAKQAAEAMRSFRFEDIPQRGVEQSKAAVIDSLGVAFPGRDEPIAEALRRISDVDPTIAEATIWSSGKKTSLLNAAFLNSTEIHCIDYDNGGSLGHPASVLLPAALAVAEKYHLSGKQVITAYAAAYELGARMRESLGDLQHGAGFHATSLLGVIACAAEVSMLLGLDAEKMSMAMSIATSLSSGMMQSFGMDSKPLQVANASRNGVLAALLAKEGMKGDPGIFEENKGFYFVYGQEKADMNGLLASFGKPVKVASERGHFKQWPCCGGNYEVLSALYNYKGERIIPEDIEEIVIRLSMDPPGPAFRTDPKTPMEGRFSVTYNVASCLLDGYVDLSTFTEEKFGRPEVQALTRKCRVVKYTAEEERPEGLKKENRFVGITICRKDGSTVNLYQGASDRLQLEGEDIYDKFGDNAAAAGIPAENIKKVKEMVHAMETLEDTGEIIRALYR